MQTVSDCIERLNPPRIRHAARSAFIHLKRAWRLHPIDSEMAMFRTITSEEEAASALILALHQQKYPNSRHLNPRRHDHKAAIWPFLQAIIHGFHEKGVPAPRLSIATEGTPRLELSIDIAAIAGLGQPLWMSPDHPFNFVMRSDEKGPFEVHRWERELFAIAVKNGSSQIHAHINKESNLRNRIIYSSNEGVPAIRFSDSIIISRLKRVTVLLIITIEILQTRYHQLFVIQAIEALLHAMKSFKGAGYDFPANRPPSDRTYIRITEHLNDIMKIEIIRPIHDILTSIQSLKPYRALNTKYSINNR